MNTEQVHSYKIKYQIEPSSAEQAKDENVGATDAFVFISMLFPKDGSLSITHFSRDGRTGEGCDPQELFKAWLYLSKTIAGHIEATEWHKACCKIGLGAFEEIMKKTIDPIMTATTSKKMDS